MLRLLPNIIVFENPVKTLITNIARPRKFKISVTRFAHNDSLSQSATTRGTSWMAILTLHQLTCARKYVLDLHTAITSCTTKWTRTVICWTVESGNAEYWWDHPNHPGKFVSLREISLPQHLSLPRKPHQNHPLLPHNQVLPAKALSLPLSRQPGTFWALLNFVYSNKKSKISLLKNWHRTADRGNFAGNLDY